MTGVVGLILAGGQSRRFGAPKALAELGGAPVIAHVAARLRLTPLAVAGPEAFACAAGAIALPDPDGATRGPLAGIAAGLVWAGTLGAAWLVTAPCDAPLIPQDMAARLVEAATLAGAPAAIARTPEGREPLCGCWRPLLLDHVITEARHPDHAPIHAFARTLGAIDVGFSDSTRFLNINTRDDLARAARLIQEDGDALEHK